MKIAVTADLHLTSKESRPERFHALENILQQMISDKIGTLVIAGDLFDQETRNYSEFESLCGQSKYKHIRFHVIPGNHDFRLSAKSFASENIMVYSKPELIKLDLMSLPILFLPYQKEQTMGEAIASFDSELKQGEWILFGHGDWADGLREPNPYEPGVYMPLTRTDIETLQPVQAILGHVHKPFDGGAVHIPGSPCGLDITETGRRRFLILDPETGSIQSQSVETDALFFDEWFVVLPVEDEEAFVRERVQSLIRKWNIAETEKKRVQIRLKISGYTSDKQKLGRVLKDASKGMRFYPEGEPDLSEVSVSEDVDRADLAGKVRKQIESMPWLSGPDVPSREEAFIYALKVIYET